MNWIQQKNGGSLIAVKVVPGASCTECTGLAGNLLKIRLSAPPVDGKANKCLISFLSEKLGVSKCSVRIVGGTLSRHKIVFVERVTPENIRAAFRIEPSGSSAK